jgi:ABC-type phosphate/phosphonate transport system substrate-binding protein
MAVMIVLRVSPRLCRYGLALLAGLLVPAAGMVDGQPSTKIKVLRIGSSGSLNSVSENAKQKSGLKTLNVFIKEETGLENEILRQKDWKELAAKMAKGDLHLGVFQGYEFAWAQEGQAGLKPLALAVNVYRYPLGYVIVNKNNPAKDFSGLKGQTLSIPESDPPFLRLFVERESQKAGKGLDAYFSKVATPENIEDAIDDVVDGVTQATVVDRAALEAYKVRKPGRFNKLRPALQSQPFPPPVIAYYDDVIDTSTRTQFLNGLLGASKKEKGQTMLTLFRLTGFETPPEDFAKVLAETRRLYPPPGDPAK